jgi:hypothetical protein
MTIVFTDGREVTLQRRPNETRWTALRRQIQDLRRTKDGEGEAAVVERQYQTDLAITAAAVPLGLAGLAICVSPFGRRRPLLTGAVAVIMYWTLTELVYSVERTLIASGSLLGVGLCAWAPNAILLITASATLLSRRSLNRPLSASRGA